MGTALTIKRQRYRTDEKAFTITIMTSPNVLRHINQKTILTTYHHGNSGKTTFLSFAERRMENQISANFDRKFCILDWFAEKQFSYEKRNNVCADRRLKIESPPLPASNLLVDQSASSTSRLQLVHRCKFHTHNTFIHSLIHSFSHSFNQSFIHSFIQRLIAKIKIT